MIMATVIMATVIMATVIILRIMGTMNTGTVMWLRRVHILQTGICRLCGAVSFIFCFAIYSELFRHLGQQREILMSQRHWQ